MDRPVLKKYKFQGLKIRIETPKGDFRVWHNNDTGKQSRVRMHFDYGYIKGTEGTDGDDVDVYVGPNKDSEKVFVIVQMLHPDFKTPDENKVMLGFDSAKQAKEAYLIHYSDPRFFGSMKEMSIDDFKKKVDKADGHLIKSKLNGLLKSVKLNRNIHVSGDTKMPFKSDAQRKFMYAAEERGDVPKGTAKHFSDATPKGKKLPEHVKDKKEKSVAALKSVTDKLEDDFVKGSMVSKVEKEDPNERYEGPENDITSLERGVKKGTAGIESMNLSKDEVNKALKAAVVNPIGRGARAGMAVDHYEESTNPDAFKAGIARQPNAVGFFNMTPAGEPPQVPVRRIEAPVAATPSAVMYKSCSTCGKMNKSIGTEDYSCSRCDSLRSTNNTASDFWRR